MNDLNTSTEIKASERFETELAKTKIRLGMLAAMMQAVVPHSSLSLLEYTDPRHGYDRKYTIIRDAKGRAFPRRVHYVDGFYVVYGKGGVELFRTSNKDSAIDIVFAIGHYEGHDEAILANRIATFLMAKDREEASDV